MKAYQATSIRACEEARWGDPFCDVMCVLYAESIEQAEELAKEELAEALYEYEDELSVELYPKADKYITPETEPGVERRDVVLRHLGWMLFGEHPCESCDLYANGIEEYEVCDDCCICADCGCTCQKERV